MIIGLGIGIPFRLRYGVGGGSTVTPQITAHRLTGVAPLAITFDSLLTTPTQIRTVNPFVVTPPVTNANFRPAGYAVASAVGTVVWDDLLAATRTLPRSMGALNP
jgi:hypothetical protein